jgi:hypothetical protein
MEKNTDILKIIDLYNKPYLDMVLKEVQGALEQGVWTWQLAQEQVDKVDAARWQVQRECHVLQRDMLALKHEDDSLWRMYAVSDTSDLSTITEMYVSEIQKHAESQLALLDEINTYRDILRTLNRLQARLTMIIDGYKKENAA